MRSKATFDVGIGRALDVTPYEVENMVNHPYFPGYSSLHFDEIPKVHLNIPELKEKLTAVFEEHPPECENIIDDIVDKHTKPEKEGMTITVPLTSLWSTTSYTTNQMGTYTYTIMPTATSADPVPYYAAVKYFYKAKFFTKDGSTLIKTFDNLQAPNPLPPPELWYTKSLPNTVMHHEPTDDLKKLYNMVKFIYSGARDSEDYWLYCEA